MHPDSVAVEPWGLDGDHCRMPTAAADRAVTPREQPRTELPGRLVTT
ncbi:hypothetical protein [Streptomyces sp. NPDC005262]